MPHPHGRFSWVDLAVPDVGAAIEFYRAVLGWDTEEPQGESMGYWFFTKDGKKAAGVGQLTKEQQEQGIPPVWSAYIAVDDVDTIATRAAELGATVVVPPMDIPDAGRMAFITDPTGAAIGFWQAGLHEGADALDAPGFITWNELGTRDVQAATDFYEALLGWKPDVQEFEGGFQYTTFVLDDAQVAGAYDMSTMFPDEVPAHWLTYISVADADEAAAAAGDAGGTILRPPSDTPYGRMAVIQDPQGPTLAVIKLTPQD